MKCIRCDSPGTETLHPLELRACRDCERAWLREESLSVRPVLDGAGLPHVVAHNYGEHMKRFSAELLKRTEAWAKSDCACGSSCAPREGCRSEPTYDVPFRAERKA